VAGNQQQGGAGPAVRHGSIKRHAFAAVLVLVTILPLAIFAFTYWINRVSAARKVEAGLLRSTQNALRLSHEVERALAMAKDLGLVNVEPSLQRLPDGSELYETYVTPALKTKLEEIEPGDPMLYYAVLLEARGNVIASFGEQREISRYGDVQAMPHDTAASLVYRVRMAARDSGRSVIAIAFPTHVGDDIAGTLVVGLSFSAINRQIQDEINENNRRALSISLAGSLALAALGWYLLKLNERARTLQSALEREQHLAYVGTLSAGLAHEIRNPLSSVKMNVQMIRNRLERLEIDDRESLLRKADRVEHEVARLEDSINDFLVFAAPRPLARKAVDINAAVESVVELIRQSEKDVDVAKLFDPDIPRLQVDESMLAECLQNLLINAMQAAGEHGKVEVETVLEKNAVCVSISDSGPGVPEPERDRIFEVFYTTKKGGTGLGLNIARRIVEDHGGSITVDASPTLGGAKFTVKLPL